MRSTLPYRSLTIVSARSLGRYVHELGVGAYARLKPPKAAHEGAGLRAGRAEPGSSAPVLHPRSAAGSPVPNHLRAIEAFAGRSGQSFRDVRQPLNRVSDPVNGGVCYAYCRLPGLLAADTCGRARRRPTAASSLSRNDFLDSIISSRSFSIGPNQRPSDCSRQVTDLAKARPPPRVRGRGGGPDAVGVTRLAGPAAGTCGRIRRNPTAEHRLWASSYGPAVSSHYARIRSAQPTAAACPSKCRDVPSTNTPLRLRRRP